jgi:disulfide bond formation protein DsbB
MGGLMLVLKHFEPESTPRTLRPLEKFAGWIFLAVVAANAVQAFASTGPPPYMGQGDPVRFSFHPRHWVWSLEEWSRAPMSFRGRWAVGKPGPDNVVSEPSSAPLANLRRLAVKSRRELSLPLQGPVTDLAYDAAGGRFLVTTSLGVYLIDGSLSRVLRHTVLDPGYSVDLGRISGGAFLDGNTVMALSENKSFVILRESEGADPDRNYRYFLESFEAFDEIARSRFSTIRAKMMYVSSLAYDRDSKRLYAVSVPNATVRRLVISGFDRSDLTLSEEYAPPLAAGSGLTLADEKRTLGEFFVTGATIEGKQLYAVSAAYSTLLTIDLESRSITEAHRIDGLDRPTGIASVGNELYIASESGAIAIVDRPGRGETSR